MIIFRTTLKRVLTQPGNWVLLVIFPALFFVMIGVGSGGDVRPSLGVVDQDNTVLSQTLIRQMDTRFIVSEVSEEDITNILTEGNLPWVLVIRDGYAENILNGNAPQLDGFALTITDVSAMGSAAAQNITRSLLMLGTDDAAVISAWEQNSILEVTTLGDAAADNWAVVAQWFSFLGFIAIFTANSMVRALVEDKMHGMPERLGVLPITARKILWQGTLAAFTATGITTILVLAVIHVRVGAIPNPAALFLLLSLYNLFAVGFILALTSTLRKLDNVAMIVTMSATIFAMLGGLFWPLELVPEFMRRLAWLSPGYWLSRGLHNIHDPGFEGFVMPMLFLGGFTVVALIFGGFKKIQAVES